MQCLLEKGGILVNQQVEMLIPRDAGADSELLSHTLVVVCITFLPSFLWPIIFIGLVYSPYLVYLRFLPCVCSFTY